MLKSFSVICTTIFRDFLHFATRTSALSQQLLYSSILNFSYVTTVLLVLIIFYLHVGRGQFMCTYTSRCRIRWESYIQNISSYEATSLQTAHSSVNFVKITRDQQLRGDKSMNSVEEFSKLSHKVQGKNQIMLITTTLTPLL